MGAEWTEVFRGQRTRGKPVHGGQSVGGKAVLPQRAERVNLCYTYPMVYIVLLVRLLAGLAVAAGYGDSDATLPINIGTQASVMTIFTGISTLLVKGIISVTAAVVTIGGIMIAAAHGNDSWVENGKKAVFGGLIGFAVVMGSYGILRAIVGFIYY